MANSAGIFERQEKKYILTKRQYDGFMNEAVSHLQGDKYGRSTICSLYFDTPDHRIIRHSLEKPVYKEKLRMRSYGVPDDDSTVFIELKKKYKGVVYKRREAVPLISANDFLIAREGIDRGSQIINEIQYFLNFYDGIGPAMYISSDREAFTDLRQSDLRFTFDTSVLYRDYDLRLENGVYGTPLLAPDTYLMEIKAATAMPLWLTGLLDRLEIFPTGFSKYGTAYLRTCATEAPALPAAESVTAPLNITRKEETNCA